MELQSWMDPFSYERVLEHIPSIHRCTDLERKETFIVVELIKRTYH